MAHGPHAPSTSAPAPADRKKYLGLAVFPLLLVSLMLGIFATAMHSPEPHDLPVAVAGPRQQVQVLAESLEANAGTALDVRVADSAAHARRLVADREVTGALVVAAEPDAPATIYTAQAAGASQASMVEELFTGMADQGGFAVNSEDLAPLPERDRAGTVGMFLTIAWILAGFLPVTLIANAAPELAPLRRLLPILACWAVVMSAVTWVIVSQIVGAIDGHLPALLGTGWLAIMAAAGIATFFSRLLGPLAVLPTILTLIFLGVPSSGGALSPYAVPALFRTLHDVLPMPAIVESVRSVLYFGGDEVGGHLLTLGLWIVAGLGLTALVDFLRHRKARQAASPGGGEDRPSGIPPRTPLPAV